MDKMDFSKDRYKEINYCVQCGSKLEIKTDYEKKLRPQCNNCGWTYYKNPIPASACVILNEKNEVVIIKRKFEPGIGKWALPSGYIEIDQDPEDCAVEEMKEENGILPLIEMVGRGENARQEKTIQAILSRYKDLAVPHVTEALESCDDDTRCGGFVVILGKIGDESSIPRGPIRKSTKDPCSLSFLLSSKDYRRAQDSKPLP